MSQDLPAILGGRPIRPQGPPEWPLPDEGVRRALEAAFAANTWGKYCSGFVERLEARLGERCGGAALTCASGTLAVEIALRAAGVAPGDEVVLAAYDYPGNFLSVHALGARPVLADVRPDDWQLSVQSLAEALGPGTRAVVVSHLHGGLVDMKAVTALCHEHKVRVIEDAAQCLGATVQGRPAGTWGDLGVFSFGGSKLVSGGRGGAIIGRDPALMQRVKLLLGRGNNLVAPLSELQAAVILPQLDLLAERHEQRARSVALLGDIAGLTPFRSPVSGSPGYYKVGFRYDEAAFALPRARFVAAMRAEGMALDEGFRALHLGRSASRFRAAGTLEEATRAHGGVVILHHPVLLSSEEEVRQVTQAVEKIRPH